MPQVAAISQQIWDMKYRLRASSGEAIAVRSGSPPAGSNDCMNAANIAPNGSSDRTRRASELRAHVHIDMESLDSRVDPATRALTASSRGRSSRHASVRASASSALLSRAASTTGTRPGLSLQDADYDAVISGTPGVQGIFEFRRNRDASRSLVVVADGREHVVAAADVVHLRQAAK